MKNREINQILLYFHILIMLQDLILPRKSQMTQIHKFRQDQIYLNNHLELDFCKNSLNTTTSSKIIHLEEVNEADTKNKAFQTLQSSQKILKIKDQKQCTKKQVGLSKVSRCFMKEIGKILKKNKIRNSQKSKKQKDLLQYKNSLDCSNNISQIHFKTKVSNKESKTNEQIKRILKQDKNKSQNFNFEEFLQHINTKNQQKPNKQNIFKNQNLFKTQNTQKIRQKSGSIVNIVFKKTPNSQNKNTLEQKYPLKIQSNDNSLFILCKDQNSQKSHKYTASINKNVQQNENGNNNHNKSLFGLSVKSSRVLSLKQSRRIQSNKKNQEQNIKLHRQLRKALMNVSLDPNNCSKQIKARSNTQRNHKSENKNAQFINHGQAFHDIHFNKLKQKVMVNMERFKKINEIRQNQQKQKKKFKKKRVFSAQQKVSLTVEGKNMLIGKNDPQFNNFKEKQYQHRRPYTAVSRTGLQYDRRQVYRRRSSDKQNRPMHPLAGIKNSANHHRTFSKNGFRDIQELDECKSDRVIRNLRQKYGSRPQTAKSKMLTTRPSTGRATKCERNSQITSPRGYCNIEYEKVTHKTIQKQELKQKLYGLLIECEEQKQCNQKLKQGLDIFQDYCDNIDKGLKQITEQIEKYIQKNQQ